MKIVILDGYSVNPGDLSWDALSSFGEVVVYDFTKDFEVEARIKDADIVLTNKVCITADLIRRMPKLKYIGVLATGVNVVDLDAAKQQGVIVTNIPDYSTDSVVQMTFAHILNFTNRVAHYAKANRGGRWSNNRDFCYWDTPLVELAGKTLGVVGLGHIGYKVACVAQTFGMDVFAFTSKNSADLPKGIQKTTLDGLFAVSDILTLHCPLTPATKGMINESSIEKMKPGAFIVNTGRGPLVDEAAVAAALTDGRLGGYGADVLCKEPPAADNPLLTAPNAYITPHIAWATFEARTRLVDIAVSNIAAFVSGAPKNVVNS